MSPRHSHQETRHVATQGPHVISVNEKLDKSSWKGAQYNVVRIIMKNTGILGHSRRASIPRLALTRTVHFILLTNVVVDGTELTLARSLRKTARCENDCSGSLAMC